MSIQFRDNSAAVKSQLAVNMTRALTAMGQVGLEMVLDTMNTKYKDKDGKQHPILLTGDLQRSMTFEVNDGGQSTTWGTNLTYGPHVHEGTARMAGRPFLRDGLLNNKDMLREVAAEELKRGA